MLKTFAIPREILCLPRKGWGENDNGDLWPGIVFRQ